jgi:hypothetical protein
MTDYKDKHGLNVQIVSSDPSDPIIGQVWYNTTTNLLKYQGPAGAGAWSTGGSLNTGRRLGAASGGQSTSLVFGGSGVPTTYKSETESYNGSAWTELNDLNTARDHTTGFGTQEDAICAGGYTGADRTTQTELWNGTSWTEVNDLANKKREMASCGTSSAGLVFGGELPAPFSAETESWNGTSWTEVNDLNTARQRPTGAGTQSAGLCYGGDKSPATTYAGETEEWNGTSWSEVSDLNTARNGMSGGGIQSSAIGIGGSSGSSVGNTEQYNGTSWSEVADLSNARQIGQGDAEINTTAIMVGGWGPGFIDTTEEFSTPDGIETISTS